MMYPMPEMFARNGLARPAQEGDPEPPAGVGAAASPESSHGAGGIDIGTTTSDILASAQTPITGRSAGTEDCELGTQRAQVQTISNEQVHNGLLDSLSLVVFRLVVDICFKSTVVLFLSLCCCRSCG